MADRGLLSARLGDVPPKPGVYLFRDAASKILYIGKAKQLRSRLRSYFQDSAGLDRRKAEMVRNVQDFEFFVTHTELEAFVLEATLIKQHKPRYNVLLRDDKSYPYLKLTARDEWPRLEVVRRIKNDGARYFGPYVPSGPMWRLLSFLRRSFRLPTCKHSFDKRMRPCLQHQMGRCDGPCAGLVDRGEYLQAIESARLILEGRNEELLDGLERKMQKLSDELRYEEAAGLRDLIAAVRQMSEQQAVVSPGLGDLDVFGLVRGRGSAVCKILFVRNGVLIGSRELRMRDGAGETDGEFMSHVIGQFYSRELMLPAEILCSVRPDDAGMISVRLAEQRGAAVKISVPRRGKKRDLLLMAEENARLLAGAGATADEKAMAELASRLGLASPPEAIAAFDISNISGSAPIGACVWWEGGSFVKNRYRQVSLDGVKGPDDFAMMKETVRRVVRSLARKETGEAAAPEAGLPDLVLIDGGRAHLDAALAAMRDEGVMIETAAVAKDPDRLFTQRRRTPLPLNDARVSSLLIRRIRDEVHRFALGRHRRQRGRALRESALDRIYGIGKARRFALLERFGSIEAIKNADLEEICRVKGFTNELAARIKEALAGSGQKKE
ncbi:MAG: excinuclease ABC subunit UvrC [Thermodesulfovibrionales bacterium]